AAWSVESVRAAPRAPGRRRGTGRHNGKRRRRVFKDGSDLLAEVGLGHGDWGTTDPVPGPEVPTSPTWLLTPETPSSPSRRRRAAVALVSFASAGPTRT